MLLFPFSDGILQILQASHDPSNPQEKIFINFVILYFLEANRIISQHINEILAINQINLLLSGILGFFLCCL